MTQLSAEIAHLNSKQSTKFTLLILFGDYIRPRGGSIWMSNLIYLLGLLDIGEHTGRSTINRMVREDWFTVDKDGRHSRFTLTAKGIQLLNSGDLRLYDQPIKHWDGKWHLVAYSLPEEKRKLRNDLRKQLAWLGYGPLSPGLWISPHNRLKELKQALKTLEIDELVHTFSSTYSGPATTQELMHQSWDLTGVAAEYEQFNKIIQQQIDQFEAEGIPSAEICFQQHFRLTAQLFPILQKDPNFPQDMLPSNWPGTTGRKLFNNYREILTPVVSPFIDQVISNDP